MTWASVLLVLAFTLAVCVPGAVFYLTMSILWTALAAITWFAVLIAYHERSLRRV